MKKEDEIRKLYESGILTKEEMKAELKKVTSAKDGENGRTKRLVIFSAIVILFVGVIAIVGSMLWEQDSNKFLEEMLIKHNREGAPRKIYLGEFTDIEKYHKRAIANINAELGGKMTFWIIPTKYRLEIGTIQIKPFKSMYLFSDPNSDVARQNRLVGPIIYEQGRDWLAINESEENTKSNYQPIAAFLGVGLTPKAEKRWREIQAFLMKGAIKSDGENWTFADGSPVSESEKELFKKHIAPAYMEE